MVSAIPNIILETPNLLISPVLNNPNIPLAPCVQYRNLVYKVMVRIFNKLPNLSTKSKIMLVLIELSKQVNASSTIRDIISDAILSLIVN